MKRDFLKDLGLEKDVIDQIMAANGEDIANARKAEQKTWEAEKEQLSTQISQFETQAKKRDADLKKLQDKLTAKENDDVKLADAQKALEDFQAQYENDKKTWEAQSKQQAYEFAAQSVLGSARLVLETGKHPGELKDMVCSPAGTTIAAVKVLEENGFRGTVINAVSACIDKSKTL